jgi:hypothetical protein
VSARANQLLEAGLWLKMSGDLDGAKKLFEQALKLDPDSIRARELLGHSLPEAEAVPRELRDVPVTRSDLFSVPLPRLFQDEPPAPASIPEEWWNAPPSDGMGNTARFFVRPPAGTPATPRGTGTIPWGPSPLPPKDDFQGDDMGESGDDFGLELSDGTPAPLSGSGRRPVLSTPELVSPAAAAASQTTGAIPLPPELGARSPVPGPPPPPGPFEEPTVVAGLSRTTGAIPLTPALVSGATSPVPGVLRPATTGAIPLPPAGTPPPIRPLPSVSPVPGPRAEPPRSGGPVPLPPAVSPVRSTPSPAPHWHPPAAAPKGTLTLETHVVVPLPSRGSPGDLPPEASLSLEPLAWAMPANPPATTPSRGAGPVPLPGAGSAPPPPRVPVASAAPPAVPPISPPPGGRLEFPSDAWGVEGDGPTVLAPEEPAAALELLAEPRTVSGLTPLPVPRDPRAEAVRMFGRARELQNLDDHSGARELLLKAQALWPELTGLSDALARSETKLQTIYESKIGKLSAVPRVRLKEDEVIWLNLDHRAGFMLAQIDGTLSFEDLFSVSGMSRLDTARILAQLLDQRVIVS